MTEEDVEASVDVAARAFEVEFSSEEERAGWVRRLRHALSTDPDGCFVSTERGRVTGVGQAIRRERLWNLSLLTVDPASQSSGAGRRLLAAACGYLQPGDNGLIVSSNDPRALRIYAKAGFDVRITTESVGAVDRSALPPADPRIREITLEQIEQLETVTRAVRGAPYTLELPGAIAWGVEIYALEDRGYVIIKQGRGVWALGAADEEAASALLWFGLSLLGADPSWPPLRWVSDEQRWAAKVAHQAGLRLHPFGALCVRGEPGTLNPYLPSGPYA
jgi:GNAT superfamily N-acetyltransferase